MEDAPAYPTPAAPLAAAPEAPAGLSDEVRAALRRVCTYASQPFQRSRAIAEAMHDFHQTTSPKLTLALLDEAADLRRELTEARAAHAAAVAKLAQEGEQEQQLLKRDEELRKLRAKLEEGWNLLHYGVAAIMEEDGDGAVKCWETGAKVLYLPTHRDIRPDFAPKLSPDPVTAEAQSLPAAGAGKEGGAAKAGNAAGYELIRQQLAKRCSQCGGVVNGHGECPRCEPAKVASHG